MVGVLIVRKKLGKSKNDETYLTTFFKYIDHVHWGFQGKMGIKNDFLDEKCKMTAHTEKMKKTYKGR